MNTTKSILDNLRSSGFRLTKIRSAIVEVLIKSSVPLSAQEIGVHLHEKKISANKTTVYRQLLSLKEVGAVQEILFGDGKARYEIGKKHHHHLVCMECNAVKDVVLEKDLFDIETKIERSSGFKIFSHSLEFFGLCPDCRNDHSHIILPSES